MVAANITYGLPASSLLCEQANVEDVAMSAGAHEFIASLTSGYQALIGESGQDFSSGQQMCVSIARALVRRPKVTVLDEATAGHNAESALLVVEALRNVIEEEIG